MSLVAAGSGVLPVVSRAFRSRVKQAQTHSRRTIRRLPNTTRSRMWTNNLTAQAMKPERCPRPRSATTLFRPMGARVRFLTYRCEILGCGHSGPWRHRRHTRVVLEWSCRFLLTPVLENIGEAPTRDTELMTADLTARGVLLACLWPRIGPCVRGIRLRGRRIFGPPSLLRAPPGMKHANEAVAWTFGMEEGEWDPPLEV